MGVFLFGYLGLTRGTTPPPGPPRRAPPLRGKQATAAWAYITSFIVLKAIDSAVGLRVTPEEEIAGLDASEHGTTAYGDFILKK